MSWDGVVGALVTLVAVAVGYWGGRKRSRDDRQMVKYQVAEVFRAQREDRQQKRFEAAYPGLLAALTAGSHWLWDLEDFTTGYSKHVRPPAPPEAAVDLTKLGTLPAVASDQVLALLGEWESATFTCYKQAQRIEFALGARGDQPCNFPEDWPFPEADADPGAVFAGREYRKFGSTRDLALEAERMLRKRVRVELAGKLVD